MKSNFLPEELEKIRGCFDSYVELTSRKKELAEEEKSIKSDVAQIIDGKQKDASLLLKSMAQIYDGEEADAHNISIILESLQR